MFWVRRPSSHTSISVVYYLKQIDILIRNPKYLNFRKRTWISILRTVFSGFMLNFYSSRIDSLSSSTGSGSSPGNLHVCVVILQLHIEMLSQNQKVTLGL